MRQFEERNAYFDDLFHNRSLRWLGQNTNHYPMHPAVREAMLECIKREEFHAYAPPVGIEELRSLILQDLGLSDASVLVTDGAVEGLYHACRTLVGPGDEIVTTDPGWKWPGVFGAASGAIAKDIPIYYAANGYKLTAEQLEAAVTPKTKIIYLTDPNNPLGTRHTTQELDAFTNIAREVGAYFIHDCTYRHFADDHSLAYPLYSEKTIVIYSFSKWLGLAGLRVGALVAHASIIEQLAKAPPNNLGCNVLSQRAAIAGLKVRHEWMPKVKLDQRNNQKMILAAVEQIRGLRVPVFPSHGNFLVIDCKEAGLIPEVVVELYQDHGIMIRQGLYHSPKFGKEFIKVSTTVPEQWVAEFCALLPEVIGEARGKTPTRKLF